MMVVDTDVIANFCSSYDCEYVALARQLGVLLVTGDTDLTSRFPNDAVLMEDFVAA